MDSVNNGAKSEIVDEIDYELDYSEILKDLNIDEDNCGEI